MVVCRVLVAVGCPVLPVRPGEGAGGLPGWWARLTVAGRVLVGGVTACRVAGLGDDAADFFDGGLAGQCFLEAVLAEGAHLLVGGGVVFDGVGGDLFDGEPFDVFIDEEDFVEGEAAPVAGVAAAGAACCPVEGGWFVEVVWFEACLGEQVAVGLVGGFALGAEASGGAVGRGRRRVRRRRGTVRFPSR